MKRRAKLLAIAFVTLAGFALFWQKQARDGRLAMAQSDAALASGDTIVAIERAREAAQHRAPFATATELGFERLDAVASDAEARGDIETMKSALLAMRSAADSTDDASWLAKANEALPRCAMRAEASPLVTSKEGCSSGGNPSCLSAMKLELATPTHPPPIAHLVVTAVAALLMALALRLTRKGPHLPAGSPSATRADAGA